MKSKGAVHAVSYRRMDIIYKQVGSESFSARESPFSSEEFVKTNLEFDGKTSGKAALLGWLSNMEKQGFFHRIQHGTYRLSNSAIALCGGSENKKSEPQMTPLPDILKLAQENYSLLEWLAQRTEELNGKSSRVADRSRPAFTNDDSWSEFVEFMIDLCVLKVIEEKDDDRTYVINKQRCGDAYCMAELEIIDPINKLLYTKTHLENSLQSLKSRLCKKEKEREEIKQEMVGVEEKLRQISRMMDPKKIQNLLDQINVG